MDSKAVAARLERELGSSSSERLAEPRTPPRISGYKLLQRIGGGSYGDVWLVRSVTGQLRAVKIVWRQTFTSVRPYDREFRGMLHFEPISRSHPGVVNVLHIGRDEEAGCFYYVMELADSAGEGDGRLEIGDCKKGSSPTSGSDLPSCTSKQPAPIGYSPRTLASDLKFHGRLPVMEAVALGVQLANSLGHLHRHGLVHRDVKPSNVIFVNRQPKLADIGLVTGADEARSFVGTEGFIPPEGPGTVKADLFGLGRLLYEAATGRDRGDFPGLPDDLDRWDAGERGALLELNEVLAKLCAPDASNRQENAAEVAGDLNLILAGRSVRRAYGIERRLRWATRTIAVTVTVLAVAAGWVWFQGTLKREAETRAERERALRERAELAEHASRRQLYTALLEQARANRSSRELGQRVRTLDAVKRAASISNSVELRREAFAAMALPDLKWEREVRFAEGENGRIFDPTLERFAVCRGRGPVEVRSTLDRRLLNSLPAATNLEAHLITWSPDGRYLAFKRDHDPGGARADLEVWDLTSTQRVVYARDRVTGNALSFHPRLPQIMAARHDGSLCVFELTSGENVRQLNLGGDPNSLQFSPEGERFAVSYDVQDRHVVAIHGVINGSLLMTNLCPQSVMKIAWHPEGRWVAAPDLAGNVRLIDSTTGEARTLGLHKGQAVEAAFHARGDFLITGSWEHELICWDLRTMQRAFTLGLNGYVVQFRRDGQQCFIHTSDSGIFFQFQPPTCHRQLNDVLGRGVTFGEFSPDGQRFAASGDVTIGVWDLRTQAPAATISSATLRVPLFAPDSSEIYVYWEGAVNRWQIQPTAEKQPLILTKLPLLEPPGIRRISVLSNELVLTGWDGVRFMPLGNTEPEKVRHLKQGGGWAQVSPDGRWLGSRVPGAAVLRVYRLPEVERAAALTNRTEVWGFAFSPRGDELAVGTRKGLEFYDTTTWQRTRELAVQSEHQCRIIYSPDARTLWHTSDGRTSALRDARTLEVLLPLPAGALPLALSANGRHLALSLDARYVQVWDLVEVRERFRDLGVDWTTDH